MTASTVPRACCSCPFEHCAEIHVSGQTGMQNQMSLRHEYLPLGCRPLSNRCDLAWAGRDSPARMSCTGHNRSTGPWHASVHLHRSSGHGQRLNIDKIKKKRHVSTSTQAIKERHQSDLGIDLYSDHKKSSTYQCFHHRPHSTLHRVTQSTHSRRAVHLS